VLIWYQQVPRNEG